MNLPLHMAKMRPQNPAGAGASANAAPATARMMRNVSGGALPQPPASGPAPGRNELLPGVELRASPHPHQSYVPTTPNRHGQQYNSSGGSNQMYSTPPPAPSSHHQQQHQQQQPPSNNQPVGPGGAFHRKSIGDWEFMKTIGSGSMGKVKLAKHRVTNEICAVKVVTRAAKVWQRQHANDPPSQDPDEILAKRKEFEKELGRDKRTIREAALGKILYHPYICRLYEMYPMSNHYYMLFEYVQGGQMLDYIVSHGSLKELQARKFCRGIASALEYCHSNNIVHRDLKIENIMINTQGEIKIIDFGLSNLFDRENLLKTYCGSLYFAAPELLSAKPYVGPEVDIWSFGVVIYVLVCGKVPFDDKSVNKLHEKIKRGEVEYPSHLSNECISILQRMLVVNPSIRGTIKEIINHPWMNKGYQGPVKNYLPIRRPLEYPLDPEVLQLIVELELAPSIDYINSELSHILRSNVYQFYVENWHNKSQRKKYDPKLPDPTRGFHPLISIYYLVDEMMERKKLKSQIQQQEIVTPPIPQSHVFNAASQQSNLPHESNHRVVTQPIPAQYQHNKADPFKDYQQPMYDLKPPQAAHTATSNTHYDRPSPIIETSLDTRSPTPPLQQSPVEESFGNSILRKLSIKKDDVRRVGSVKVTTKEKLQQQQQQQQQQQLQQQQQQQQQSTSAPRRHQRAASAYTASAFVSDKLPPVPQLNHQQTLPIPERKYHPTARAKSVGHARKYSLNIPSSGKPDTSNAPPLPQISISQYNNSSRGSSSMSGGGNGSGNGSGNGDNEFFDEEDNSNVQFQFQSAKVIPPKLSEKEIIEQYEKALPGTMPSIDYPKTLFLKGFFSVQTTSTKPLPVIRYGIISVLPQLGVQFVEVKGGFICVHYPSIVLDSPVSPTKSMSPSLKSPKKSNENTLDELISSQDDELKDIEENTDDYDEDESPEIDEANELENFKSSNSSSSTKNSNSFITSNTADSLPPTTPQKGHRRKFSLGNSILASQQQPGSSSSNARNRLSITTSGMPVTGNESSNIPNTPAPANLNRTLLNDDSNESLAYDETMAGGSDMLISSRVEQQRISKNTSTVKKPLKFEIHIVKVPLVGLYGIQFKKVSGNTWLYKSLASEILGRLNL